MFTISINFITKYKKFFLLILKFMIRIKKSKCYIILLIGLIKLLKQIFFKPYFILITLVLKIAIMFLIFLRYQINIYIIIRYI